MLSNGDIRIVPDEIIFRDLTVGDKDKIDVWIHYIGKKPIKVRFSVPYDSPFEIISPKIAMLASGLEAKVCIQYVATTNEIKKSELIISASTSSISVPITAYPPSAQVHLNVQNIDCGLIPEGNKVTKTFSIANFGSKAGEFALRCSSPIVTFNIASGILPVGEAVEVEFSFVIKKAGKFKFTINVDLKNSNNKLPPLNVSGEILQQVASIQYNGKDTKEIDFGQIYFTQRKVITVTIQNKSKDKRIYSISQPIESKANSRLSTTKTSIGTSSECVFTITPNEGQLNPNGSAIITLIFEPPSQNVEREMIYNFVSNIKLSGVDQQIPLNMTGSAVPLSVSIPDVDFIFGNQKIETKKEKNLTIENESEFQNVTYSIKPMAAFRFTPESGLIKPKTVKSIVVTFYPKSIGVYDAQTNVNLCNGLKRINLNLIGTGTAEEITEKFVRTPIYEMSESARYAANHPGKYGLSKEEIIIKQKQNEDNRRILIESAQKHEKLRMKKTLKERFEKIGKEKGKTDEELRTYVTQKVREAMTNTKEIEEVNLNLKHAEGLVEPEPNYPLETKIHKSKKTKTLQPLPPTVFIEKKFKSNPVTPPEITECQRVLSPVQQMSLVMSSKPIDFGRVSILSKQRRSFNITNTLNQFILVTMEYESQELSLSTPLSQVVPPKQTAGFDIIFMSENVGEFRQTIHYTVNKSHGFQFDVVADAIPIEVNLSEDLLDFTFPNENYTDLTVCKTINIMNDSTAIVDYKWLSFDDTTFSVDSERGKINPNSNAKTMIIYRPGSKPYSEQTVKLSFTGGGGKSLQLRGNCGDVKVTVEKKKFDIGILPLGMTKEFTVSLKNQGKNTAIFNVFSNDGCDDIDLKENKGFIKPDNIFDLHFTFNPQKAQVYEITYTVEIAGQNPVVFSVVGESLMPLIQIKTDSLDFGNVFVGSNESRKISIENVGLIPAKFSIDLTKYSYFSLEYSTDLMVSTSDKSNQIFVTCPNDVLAPNNLSKQSSSISLTRTNSTLTSQSNLTRTNSTLTNQSNLARTNSSLSKQSVLNGCEYTFIIHPKTTIDVNLVFKPLDVGDFSFDIYFTLIGLQGTSTLAKKKVTAVAMHSPLSISENFVDFGVVTLKNEKNPNTRPCFKHLLLKNESQTGIKYRFDKPSSEDFGVDQETGFLSYCGTEDRFVSFSPTKPGPFVGYITVYAESEKGEVKVTTIMLTGVGTDRLFKTSQENVVLPIVPLNVRSEVTIEVINSAAIEGKIDIKKSVSDKTFPLEILFTNGNYFSHSTTSLPLKISFLSGKPISFVTQVLLVAENGCTYSFTVYCGTDNSVLTLYPFLLNNKHKFVSQPSKPIVCQPLTKMFKPDYLSSLIVDDTKGDIQPILTPTLKQTVKDFLNCLVLTNKIDNFPGDLVSNCGLTVQEIIENICGVQNKPQGMLQMFKTSKTNDILQNKYERLKSMINFLKSVGCHLQNVLPEFLLPKDLFLQYMRTKVTEKILGLNYYGSPSIKSYNPQLMNDFTSTPIFSDNLIQKLSFYDQNYDKISGDSWLTVILQIFKVFLFPTLNCEDVNQVPGISQKLLELKEILPNEVMTEIHRKTKEVLTSNCYTNIESIMLEWLTINYDYFRKNSEVNIITSFEQLSDCRVIASLFKNHVQRMDLQLNLNPKTENDHRQNLELILNKAKEINLKFNLSEEMIENEDLISLSLFCFSLFQYLPHYANTTDLVFSCNLSKNCQQMIEISNPSSQKLRYDATITGSDNFTLPKTFVLVPAHQLQTFFVEYYARTHLLETATLTLTPRHFLNSQKSEEIDVLVKNESRTDSRIKLKQSRTSLASSTNKPKPPTAKNSMPMLATPIVIEMRSNVDAKVPSQIVNVSGKCYEVTKFNITVKNELIKPGTFEIFTRTIFGQENFSQKVIEFIENPDYDFSNKLSKNEFDVFINDHSTFILKETEVYFETDKSEVTITGDFIPINVGEYYCLIFFKSKDEKEFLYQINAMSSLPTEIEIPKIKIEERTEKTIQQNLQLVNSDLCKSIAYSIVKKAQNESFISEQRFKQFVEFKSREIATIALNCFTNVTFTIENGLQTFYKIPSSLTIDKEKHMLPVTFCPVLPGDYPCTIVMKSNNDIRVYKSNGVSLGETKTFRISVDSYLGNTIVQNIPLQNTSKSTWTFKISSTDEKVFTFPQRFFVNGQTTGELPLTIYSNKKGVFVTDLTVFNMTKEQTTIYKITANIDDPPSIDTIVVSCKARERKIVEVETPLFQVDGKLNVECDVAYVTFPEYLEYKEGKCVQKSFQLEIMSPITGVAAGKIICRDDKTGLYFWWAVRIDFEYPKPSDTITVQGLAKQSTTFEIPVVNPSNVDLTFDVCFDDKDIYGDRKFFIQGNSASVYKAVFCPLSSGFKETYIRFVSETAGEYVYLLKLYTEPADVMSLKTLYCVVGEEERTEIKISNPLQVLCHFSVSNSSPMFFELLVKDKFEIQPNDTVTIPVVFRAASVGLKECGLFMFNSPELGEMTYSIIGIGKPPQPLSPMIFEAPPLQMMCTSFNFTSPFPFPVKFSLSLSNQLKNFDFINKNLNFVMRNRGQIETISLLFQPQKSGKYEAECFINAQEIEPPIVWSVPLIGISEDDKKNFVQREFVVNGRANEISKEKFVLPIEGERGGAKISTWIKADDEEYQWITNYVDYKSTKEQGKVILDLEFKPKRPVDIRCQILVQNDLKQQWTFPLLLRSDPPEPCETYIMECALNSCASLRPYVREIFPRREQFRAYIMKGGSNDFSVNPSDGFISATEQSRFSLMMTELPLTVYFRPRQYGKKMEATLIIDTKERQFVFNLKGQVPEYIPPFFVTSGRLDSGRQTPRSATARLTPRGDSARTPRGEVKQRNFRVPPNSARSPK
ncbi:hypothetical protein TVAG_473440 [Trichomonas vaginalis G3]|uniref:Calponin-homology (CH) domain-containing protein n=1 Tax=Trichomonas vaginalis (strain ATCC PRA-98 / G3) TaxID=412133 RepID=A2EUG1_TRIV3|nr:cilia- and flagella-associated protein 47 family [Trichomonas vaginalis G3]EAY03720.1 hypothetical protein TVAG_473440 [Trichomonas vaginalis G3]KAI5529016.1 cilia- and flagella-associated protein 47 family [Trichomonas vaginalis G3]|eukprot:XP_001315943.1 hypothetical protein [Trichomonas vaginalis G3]